MWGPKEWLGGISKATKSVQGHEMLGSKPGSHWSPVYTEREPQAPSNSTLRVAMTHQCTGRAENVRVRLRASEP